MIVIVAGSRGIEDYEHVVLAIEASGFDVTCLVSGRARGVDQLGERWAAEHKVPIKGFPADWNRYGKRAGYIRNDEMAQYAILHADLWGGAGLIAIWDGESRGTQMMIDIAKQRGMKVFVYDARAPLPRAVRKSPRPLARWAKGVVR